MEQKKNIRNILYGRIVVDWYRQVYGGAALLESSIKASYPIPK